MASSSQTQAPLGATAEEERRITFEFAGPNDLTDLVRISMESIEATDVDRVWFWDASKSEDVDVRSLRRARCHAGLRKALQNAEPDFVDSRVIKAVRGNKILGFVMTSSYSDVALQARREQVQLELPKRPAKKPPVKPVYELKYPVGMWTDLEAWAMDLTAMQEFARKKYRVVAIVMEEDPQILHFEFMAIPQEAFEERYVITRGLIHAVEELAVQKNTGYLIFTREDRAALFDGAGVLFSKAFGTSSRVGFLISYYPQGHVADRVANRQAQASRVEAGPEPAPDCLMPGL